MKQKFHNDISESQVEDALVANLFYLAEILEVKNDLRLIVRQLKLKEGQQRIDLLLASGKNLYLIELKVVKYSDDFLIQVLDYREELLKLQENESLISGEIYPYIIVPEAKRSQIDDAKKNGVQLIIYKPVEVLNNYYKNLASIAPFLKIKPNDYGVFSLGLINRTLNQLRKGILRQDLIAEKIKLSKGSVHNHLRIAKEFGLARERNKTYFLTDIGDEFVSSSKGESFIERLTVQQVEILKQFVANNPFYSSTVFGIYAIVESSFLLSRNSYPIELDSLRKMFQVVSGKVSEWQKTKSLSTATYTFLNFAIDLELLGKIG